MVKRRSMKRSLTTSFAAPPPTVPQPEASFAPTWRELAPTVAALIGMLEIMETSPAKGPAQKAHRSTMRRHGAAAAAVGGSGAMEEVLRQVAEADTSRAERRSQLIREAWTGLPGWGA